MKVTISEARFNDLVYLTLKRYFFEPMYGEGTYPRECDIRVVMNMVHHDTWKGPPLAAAILLPGEVAPSSHDARYEVETDDILAESTNYVEDHWLKCPIEEASGNPTWKAVVGDDFKKVVELILGLPEESCGPKGK